jgi:hypothetical protein
MIPFSTHNWRFDEWLYWRFDKWRFDNFDNWRWRYDWRYDWDSSNFFLAASR